MKTILVILLQVIVISQSSAQYEVIDFQKIWVCNSKEARNEEGTNDGHLEICAKSATWQVFSNQLYLTFEHKMKGDTLIILYKGNDVGRGFMNFKLWPVVNKPFAKIYRVDNQKLGIMYLNNAFVKAIKQSVNASIEEKKLIFPTILFLNEKRKPACVD